MLLAARVKWSGGRALLPSLPSLSARGRGRLVGPSLDPSNFCNSCWKVPGDKSCDEEENDQARGALWGEERLFFISWLSCTMMDGKRDFGRSREITVGEWLKKRVEGGRTE